MLAGSTDSSQRTRCVITAMRSCWLHSAQLPRQPRALMAELALLSNVDIQIIPFDTLSYEPLSYAFRVLRFDHDSATDIVYIEMYDNAVYLDKPPEAVRQYVELQRRLQAIALGPVESRNFMVEPAGQFAAKPD
ncbi:MAG: Scr1 family TA system antitoxin-like transcriptional regulator [Pseudonocardiaceae bacterium]